MAFINKKIRDTVILLRFPFSFFLMPVFLLGYYLSEAEVFPWAAFFILHVLVYPASNGYNSYQDRDEGPIGALRSPPQSGKFLLFTTLAMDLLALTASYRQPRVFLVLVLVYIICSRAYSYRGIRFKQYALLSYFIVSIMQGTAVFFMALVAAGLDLTALSSSQYLAAGACYFLLGASYPLTQIYQHEADRQDGVHSLSARLGFGRTFVFAQTHALIATVLLFLAMSFWPEWVLWVVFSLPVSIFLFWWQKAVKKDIREASFDNTLKMSIIGALSMNACFLLLILIR